MKCTEPLTIIDVLDLYSATELTPATHAAHFFYIDVHEYRGFTIRLKSTVDQPVILTVYGNFARGTTGGNSFPDKLTLGVGSTTTQYGFITFHASRTAWVPWVYCSTQTPAGAATTGHLYADIIKFDPMQD